MKPGHKFNDRATKADSFLCVGLDSDIERLPLRFRDEPYPQFSFNRWIVEQTNEFVAAYKPNIAFYEARGDKGIRELKMTADYLRSEYPDIFLILDAKRADIGNTNRGYVAEIFDWLGFDAVTLHPYLGREALQPFLDRSDKVSIILCRTSNKGAPEFQDCQINGKFLWQVVAEKVATEWNTNRNCMLVVGGTFPDELRQIRKAVGEMTFLVPGIGAQEGDLEAVIRSGINSDDKGLIISSSRTIIFSADPAVEARKLRNNINLLRTQHRSLSAI
jgi:orotidine-5'-phosphate decarboxylase